MAGGTEHKLKQAPAPLVSPPSVTGVGVDTTLAFAHPVRQILIHNQTAVIVTIDFDQAAAPGSPTLAANEKLVAQIPCQTIHLLTAAAQPINAASGIVVRGW